MNQKRKKILKWFNSKKIREKLIFILMQLALIQAIVIFVAYLIIGRNVEQIIIFILVTSIVSIILLCLISIFSYIYIIKPIENLTQYIKMLKLKGNKCIRLPKGKLKEITKHTERLVEADVIIDKIDVIIDKIVCKEVDMKKNEFEILQSGIKTHFLYNTLNGIADLAQNNSDEKTYDAIMSLGNFYRNFLSDGRKEISLKEEIEMVKNYLKIQKLRYEDMFEAEYEIDEKLLDIIVPKLILQPLVENSLYHGIRLKGEKGIVKISIYKEGENMHIVVFDTGVGMSQKQLNSIMGKGGNGGFGLKSTIRRIQYYYNVIDSYEITTKEGFYFKIDIRIPM